MTKEEKAKYIQMPSVGVSATLNGLEVKAIEYGINDRIVFTIRNMRGNLTAHSARICYKSDRPFFRFEDYRIYLDEIIKV